MRSDSRYFSAKAMPVPMGTWAPTMPWPPQKPVLRGEHMHGAALALRYAGSAAREFGKHQPRRRAAGNGVSVAAIAGDEGVVGANGPVDADGHRFLPDVEVAKAADQPQTVHLASFFLEAAQQQHTAVAVKQLLAGNRGFGGREFGAARRGGHGASARLRRSARTLVNAPHRRKRARFSLTPYADGIDTRRGRLFEENAA